MEPPKMRYARSGDVNIAYQVLGDGPIDLVHVPPFISNLELQWQDRDQARYFRRLASFSRLIMFDKRGTGLSDRVSIASLEERMDDVRAVMDAVGSERAAIFGSSEGGAMSLLFAATYPDRVTGLVLYGAYPRMAAAPDYSQGLTREVREQWLEALGTRWGQGAMEIGLLAPSRANDPAFLEAQASWERLSASPGAAVALLRMIFDIDVRHLLSAVQVQLWSSTGRQMSSTLREVATLVRTSRARRPLSFPVRTTSRTSATKTLSLTRSKSS
jgi:pimeloyl-ACP methyl ester carboxylesterase